MEQREYHCHQHHIVATVICLLIWSKLNRTMSTPEYTNGKKKRIIGWHHSSFWAQIFNVSQASTLSWLQTLNMGHPAKIGAWNNNALFHLLSKIIITAHYFPFPFHCCMILLLLFQETGAFVEQTITVTENRENYQKWSLILVRAKRYRNHRQEGDGQPFWEAPIFSPNASFF